METEAFDLRAQLLDHHRTTRNALRRHAHPCDPRIWLLTQHSAALDRGGAEERQEALLEISLGRLELTLLAQEPAPPAQAQDP
jgi:hypothetical protein